MSAGFTQDDVEQILRVVDGLSDVEVRLEVGDLKLHVRKFGTGTAGSAPSTVPAPPPAAPPVPDGPPSRPAAPSHVASGVSPAAAAAAPGTVAIRAPTLGTFYRAPSPAEPPFVEVGSRVQAGDPVGIVEVMKLFNTINAGVAGTIEAIVAENGQMVEQDDVLFLVRADA